MKSKDQKSTQRSRVTVEQRQGQERGLATLDPLEEKVIRMLHGLGESDETKLEYAVGASADARQRLALLEAHNIADLDGEIPVNSKASDAEASIQRLLNRYSA